MRPELRVTLENEGEKADVRLAAYREIGREIAPLMLSGKWRSLEEIVRLHEFVTA